jgi:uncharacterized protein (DUF885 family)
VALALVVFLGACSAPPHPTSSWIPPSLADVQARLHGDSFDDFVTSSSRLYLLRFPQVVAQLGAAEALGIRNDRLNDYSVAYDRETAAIEGYFLDRLQSFDREALAPAQRAAYDVYQWMWTRSAARRALGFSGYAVNSTMASPDVRLSRLFTTDLPFEDEEDLADYLACLRQAAAQIREIELRVDAEGKRGIVPPDGVLSAELAMLSLVRIRHTDSRDQIGLFQKISGTSHPFYLRMRDLASRMPALPREKRSEYMVAAREEIEQRIIPAFERLYNIVAHRLSEIPTDAVGIGALFGAETAYVELLREYSGTLLRPDEVHRLAQAHVERARLDIDKVSPSLGIRAGTPLASLFLYLQGEKAEPDADSDGEPVVADAPAPTRGLPMSRAQPTILPFGVGSDNGDDVAPWGLAASDPFYGFMAGCRLYLAQVTWEEQQAVMGSPRTALAALLEQYEAAVAAVVDTGIHTLGWGLRAATTYYQDAIGLAPFEARYQVGRLAAAPGLAAGRYAAYCRIVELRARAQEEAGDAFILDRFHDWLLEYGARPLETFGDPTPEELSDAAGS